MKLCPPALAGIIQASIYFIDRERAAVGQAGRQRGGEGAGDAIWKWLENRWGKSRKIQFVVLRCFKECLHVMALEGISVLRPG